MVKKQDPCIKLKEETKQTLRNLDFVRKNTDDEIVRRLINFYEEHQIKNKK